MLDKIDRKILEELQQNADRKIWELEKKLNIPRTTIHNRIQKLKREQVIRKIKAVVDREKLGRPLTVLVHLVITSKDSAHDIANKLKRLPEVEEVYILAGQFDIMAKVNLMGTKELGKFIFDQKAGLRSWPGIERTESMVVLDGFEDGVISSS